MPQNRVCAAEMPYDENTNYSAAAPQGFHDNSQRSDEATGFESDGQCIEPAAWPRSFECNVLMMRSSEISKCTGRKLSRRPMYRGLSVLMATPAWARAESDHGNGINDVENYGNYSTFFDQRDSAGPTDDVAHVQKIPGKDILCGKMLFTDHPSTVSTSALVLVTLRTLMFICGILSFFLIVLIVLVLTMTIDLMIIIIPRPSTPITTSRSSVCKEADPES